MLELFKKYKIAGDNYEALITGRNLFNKNSDNTEVFEAYYDFLCSLTEDSGRPISERQNYLYQAEATVALFSENATMNEHTVDLIKAKQRRLNDISDMLDRASAESEQASTNKKFKENEDAVVLLAKLTSELGRVSDQTQFNMTLDRVVKVDGIIEEEYMSSCQINEYKKLSQKCVGIIEQKMRDFEREKNATYNISAVEAYERIFKSYKENGLNETGLESLKGLFDYDASRLFNETLVYYNHVYSYILSRLEDDGKLLITKYAIISEKNRR